MPSHNELPCSACGHSEPRSLAPPFALYRCRERGLDVWNTTRPSTIGCTRFRGNRAASILPSRVERSGARVVMRELGP